MLGLFLPFLGFALVLSAVVDTGGNGSDGSDDLDDTDAPDGPGEPAAQGSATASNVPGVDVPDITDAENVIVANPPPLSSTVDLTPDGTADGGPGDDAIVGTAGNDVLNGLGGDDVIDGFAGDDTLSGGEGDDFLLDVEGSNAMSGGEGDDFLVAFDVALGDPDTLDGGAGNDILLGDDGDTLTGGDGTDGFVVPINSKGGAPVVIKDLDLYGTQGGEDSVVLIDDDGNIVPRSAFFDGTYLIGIGDLPDGAGAAIYNGGDVVAIIEGYEAEDLFYQTSWIGNFAPQASALLNGDDALTGTDENDELFGGSGQDTLSGEDGNDYLDGQGGDDLLIGTDARSPGDFGDTLVGGDGDDTLRGDDSDQLAGAAGSDTYEVVAGTDRAPGGATIIETFDFSDPDELIVLVDASGTPLSGDGLEDRITLAASDGGTVISVDGDALAVISGTDPDDIPPIATWLGNLSGTTQMPDEPMTPTPQGELVTVTGAADSGLVVSERMFGGNAVFSFNTDQGAPTATFSTAVDALGIEHLRFPAGQGDIGDIEEDGVEFLNIVKMEPDGAGGMVLRPELTDFLDYARDPNGDGDSSDAIQVTLVIPVKGFTIPEYEEFAAEIEVFAETVMTEYGDVVEAFEIGSEYWRLGETTYGTQADIAAKALASGMENAGLTGDEQADILVQMASPFSGSEFERAVDDRPFSVRAADANQQIIDQLSDEARAEIDGVVEHYYYNQTELAYLDNSLEVSSIDQDLAVWDENFDKELDVYITEWNVRASDTVETGLRSASTMLQQVENMTRLGVDVAHVWPVQHNMSTDLAGGKTAEPLIDAEGRVVNSPNGAIFDLMAESLPGLSLVDTQVAGDDGSFELDVYRSDEKTVVYLSSRSLETLDLTVDLSGIVPDFDEVSAVKVGIDPTSSDGVHFVPGQGYVEADFVIVDGERYYYDENDANALVTDVDITTNTPFVELKPFEVIEITFTTSTAADLPGLGAQAPVATGGQTADPGPGIEATQSGTPADDQITGTGEADFILGGPGNDTIDGEQGNDVLEGGEGDDEIVGNRGDDRIEGEDGDDVLSGWGGEDSLSGGAGNDALFGNQGNDDLIGQGGDDTLNGGSGNDVLDGRLGADRLIGGEGADTLTGGDGADVFVLSEGDVSDGDVITDFMPGIDIIEIDIPSLSDVSDLSAEQGDGYVVLSLGTQGALRIEGSFDPADILRPENFEFRSAS